MLAAPDNPLSQRYQLRRQIAIGGYGEVWEGTDLRLDRPVAVKLLLAAHVQHPQTLARFQAEARHAGALNHENIARLYDYAEPDPPTPPYLVMELVDGPALTELLAAGPMDPAQVMDIVAQTAAGLHAAHQAGLVHRDIKPGNLLLDHRGVLKITDFGISHAADSTPITTAGSVVGTPGYIAPERVGGVPASPASDMYSLGIVAYECLMGAAPFAGIALEVAMAHRDRPMPPLPSSVPDDVANLVGGLTAKDPLARPATAGVLAEHAAAVRDRLRAAGDSQPSAPRDMTATRILLDPLGPTVPAAPPAPAAPVPVTPAPQPSGPRDVPEDRDAREHSGPPATVLPAVPAVPPAPGPGEPAVPAFAGPPAAPAFPSGRHAQPSRRRGRAVALALVSAVAGVLLFVAVTRLIGSAPPHHAPAAPAASPSTSTSGPASPPSAVAQVNVDTAALIGQPVDVVTAHLRQLGLSVRVGWQASTREPAGRVLYVQPGGRLRSGTVVTVTGALTPSASPGPGGSPSTSPSTPANSPSTPANSPSTPAKTAHGHGHGNGNGNGQGNGNGKAKGHSHG